jgi:hypothetical protein
MSAAAEVKGTAINATVRFLTERFGPTGLKKVVEGLSPQQRAILDSGVLVSSWYPFSLVLDLTRRAQHVFGDQVPRMAREMGRSSADYALTTIYKIFFKVGSPQFIIAKASSVYKTYYSTGELAPIISEKGHAILEMKGFSEPAPELCDRLTGWMERTLELSGATEIRMMHPQCVNRGDACCRFEGFWS